MDISSVGPVPRIAAIQAPQITPDQVAERREVIKAAGVINSNQAVGPQNELVVSFDRASHRAVTKIIDRKTKEVILQVPLESVLKLAQSFSDEA